jgi:hypothetical protein
MTTIIDQLKRENDHYRDQLKREAELDDLFLEAEHLQGIIMDTIDDDPPAGLSLDLKVDRAANVAYGALALLIEAIDERLAR